MAACMGQTHLRMSLPGRAPRLASAMFRPKSRVERPSSRCRRGAIGAKCRLRARRPSSDRWVVCGTAIPVPRLSERRQCRGLGGIVLPLVAEAREIPDGVEAVVDITEILADPLDQCPHIGAIAIDAVAGDEAMAMHDVVDIAVA